MPNIDYLAKRVGELRSEIAGSTVVPSEENMLRIFNYLEKMADTLAGIVSEIRSMQLDQEKRDDHARERRERGIE